METKNEYIDQLLSDLKELENRISDIKASDSFSFTFFRDSFNKTQEIMRALHELENLHIEDMKKQMEKLVIFMSENKESAKVTVAQPLPVVEEPTQAILPDEIVDTEHPVDVEKDINPLENKRNRYAEGVSLPEYVNPRAGATKANDASDESGEVKPVIRSVNDMVSPPPANWELKRGLSLNDRFLFQRELFKNDRHEMNALMIKLNAFDNYADTEKYLREHTGWNFEDKIVKDFLLVVKEGFL